MLTTSNSRKYQAEEPSAKRIHRHIFVIRSDNGGNFRVRRILLDVMLNFHLRLRIVAANGAVNGIPFRLCKPVSY